MVLLHCLRNWKHTFWQKDSKGYLHEIWWCLLYFLTTGFTFWSYLRKTEMARLKKNLQPICISIFYMVYVHITEIWYWNNLTVRIEVGFIWWFTSFRTVLPTNKQDGLMSVKTPRHIHICSYNNPTKLLQSCILRLMKPLSIGK